MTLIKSNKYTNPLSCLAAESFQNEVQILGKQILHLGREHGDYHHRNYCSPPRWLLTSLRGNMFFFFEMITFVSFNSQNDANKMR
jgi:hypothetical protein